VHNSDFNGIHIKQLESAKKKYSFISSETDISDSQLNFICLRYVWTRINFITVSERRETMA